MAKLGKCHFWDINDEIWLKKEKSKTIVLDYDYFVVHSTSDTSNILTVQ